MRVLLSKTITAPKLQQQSLLSKTPQTAKMETTAATRHTCLKLEIHNDTREPVFVKGTWFEAHFDLSVTDGLHSWVCYATEDEVEERAAQWDQSVSEYIQLAEKHLGFQIPGSVYRFEDANDGCKRLSWTFEKEGMTLQWRWKFQPSPDSKKTTSRILDFLMDANIRLSEEVVRKTQSFERIKGEAEKCLAQSEKYCSEKVEFESAIYAKFLAVLNSKKQKIRELRDQLSKKQPPEREEDTDDDEEEKGGESTDKTESFDEDDDGSEEEAHGKATITSVSSGRVRGRGRGRKRSAHY
ncbi:DNA repair protein XRCC4 [Linum perenne]